MLQNQLQQAKGIDPSPDGLVNNSAGILKRSPSVFRGMCAQNHSSSSIFSAKTTSEIFGFSFEAPRLNSIDLKHTFCFRVCQQKCVVILQAWT